MEILFDKVYPVLDAVAEAGHLAYLGYPQPTEFARANAFFHLLGPQPSRGWMLLSRETLNKIDINASHSLLFRDDPGNVVQLYGLWICKARNITPGDDDDPAACYLVELADVRHKLADQFLGIGMNKQYNVRAADYGGDYYEDTKNASVAWTWATMIQDMWLMMPQLGAWPGMPFTPVGGPRDWIFAGCSAWKAMNEVLYRLGCAVKCNIFTDPNTYTIVRIGAADSTTDSVITTAGIKYRKIYDADFIEPDKTRVPGHVRVYTHRQNSDYGTEDTTGKTAGDQWSTNAVHKNDVAGPDSKADSAIYHSLWDDLPALYDATDVLTNAAALSTRANDYATSWYGMVYGSGGDRLHKIFSGVLSLQPGSTLRAVVWKQDQLGIGRPDKPGGVVTEVMRWPFYEMSISQSGQMVKQDNYVTSTSIQAPAFVAGYANYPHLFQKIRITTTTADSNGRFTGFVQRYNPTTRAWVDREACYSIDQNGALDLALLRYDGRLSGFDTTIPVYTIDGSGGSSSLIVQDTRYCTVLQGSITSGATSLSPGSTALFPASNGYYIKIDDELLQVTAGAGTATWTVTRAQLGTTAAAHNNGSQICSQTVIANTLNGAINSSVTALVITSASNFPSYGMFYIQIDNEKMLVTDGPPSANWTVLRGQLGTTAASHSDGATITHLLPDTQYKVTHIIFDDSAFVQPADKLQHYVVHHEVDQVVRIVSSSPDEFGYYDAFIQKYDSVNRVWKDDIEIWVRDVNT